MNWTSGLFALRILTAAVYAAVLFNAVPATAAEDKKEEHHWITGEIAFELENDATVASEDPDGEINDLYAAIEPSVTVHFTPEFSLTALGVFEAVRDPDPGDDRYLDGHGLYLEELHLDYETERFSLIGGKFAPNFGKAWDEAPGVFGTGIAEDYELSERIGFGGGVNFGSGAMGEHTLSASLFFLDTSPLSDATITSRPRNFKSDGGPSNTESPKSFAVALDGALPGPTDLTYHLAFVNQAEGEGDTADERGLAVALSRPFKAGDVEFTPLVEFVHLWNADAVEDQSRDYITVALGVGWQSWNAAAVYTRRDSDFVGSEDMNDSLFQLSAGYEFPIGLTLDLGWQVLVEENITSHTIGTLLTYNLDFAFLKKSN